MSSHQPDGHSTPISEKSPAQTAAVDLNAEAASYSQLWVMVLAMASTSVAAGVAVVLVGSVSANTVVMVGVLLAGVLIVFATFVNWRLAFYALAFAVPLSSVVLPNSTTTVFRLVGAFAVVAFTIGVWRDAKLRTFVTRDVLDQRMTMFLIGFVAVAFATGLWATDATRWGWQLFTWVSLVAVFVGLSAMGRTGVGRIWSTMLAGSVAAGVWALIAQAQSGPAGRDYGRLSLNEWDPNGLALAFGAVVMVTAVRRYNSRPGAIAAGVAQSLLLAVVLLTGSRTGAVAIVVAALVGVAVTLVIGRDRGSTTADSPYSSVPWLAVSALAGVVMILSIPSVSNAVGDLDVATSASQERIAELFSGGTVDASGRGEIWIMASSVAADNVLLGVGAGNLEVETLERGLPRLRDSSRGAVAHNTALQILAEVGVFGAFLYFGFWVTALVLAIGMVRTGDRLALALLLGLVVFGVGSLTLSLQDAKTPIFLAGSIAALHIARGQFE